MTFRGFLSRGSLRLLVGIAAGSSLACGFAAWLVSGFPDPPEAGFTATGNELECLVDIRPQGMPGASSITLSSRGPEMLSDDGELLRQYRLSRDCAAGFSFSTLEAAEADWRLFYSLRVGQLAEAGDPLFAMQGQWCEVPGTLRCAEREEMVGCRSMGLPFEATPDLPLPVCDPPDDPFALRCDGDPCGEVVFGDVMVDLDGASAPRQRVLVENAAGEGGAELRIAYDGALFPADGPDGLAEFRIEENECLGEGGGEVVVPSDNPCGFTIVFQPTSVGEHRASIELAYSYAGDEGMIQESATLPVRGSGVAAAGSCVDVTCIDGSTCTAIDFGAVELGTTSGTEGVMVTNCGPDGSPDVALEAPTVDPADADFSVAPGSCGPSLAPGSWCEYDLTFAPPGGSPTGPRSASLDVRHRFAGETVVRSHLVTLNAEAEAPLPVPGCLSVICIDGSDCDRIDFGTLDVGQTATPIGVTVSNCGAAGAPEAVVSYEGTTSPVNSDFAIDPGACFADGAETLAVGGPACDLEIAFSPTADGPRPAATSFDYQFTGSATVRTDTIELEGIGDGRILEVIPLGGTCLQDVLAGGCTQPSDFEIRNAGTVAVTVDCIGFDLDPPPSPCNGFLPGGGFQATSLAGAPPLGLGPGQAGTLRIRWCGDPGTEAAATLDVVSDDRTEPEIEVPVERRIDCTAP